MELQNEYAAALIEAISEVSFDELNYLVDRISKELNDRKNEEVRKLIEETRERALKLGISPESLFTANPTAKPAREKASGPKTTIAPKYRNPNNPNETWTGRGNSPAWFKAQLEAGKTKEELEIPKEEAAAA